MEDVEKREKKAIITLNIHMNRQQNCFHTVWLFLQTCAGKGVLMMLMMIKINHIGPHTKTYNRQYQRKKKTQRALQDVTFYKVSIGNRHIFS